MQGQLDKFINSISNIRDKSNLELECRFKNITWEYFKNIYNECLNDNESIIIINKSVVSIIRKGTDTGILMELKIKNGKTEKEYREKKIIGQPFFDNSKIIPYKLTLSNELIIDPIDMDNTDIIRVKIRISFILKNNPYWRYDLTIMRQLSGQSAQSSLKTIVNNTLKQKFNELNIFEVLDLEENNKLYNFEIETEYIGDITKINKNNINDSINYIIGIIDPNYISKILYNDYIYEISKSINYHKQINRFTLKEILPQVELLNKDIYCKMYPPKNLYVTDKADGLRSILIVKNGKINFITSDVITHNINNKDIYCICDCELVGDIIYIFDVIQYNSLNLISEGYSKRIEYIPKLVKEIGNNLVKGKYIYSLNSNGEASLDNITKALKCPYPYECDGLIFIEDNNDYLHTKSYKWKPLEHTTIDFLAKKYEYQTNIKVPEGYKLYYLFNGINSDLFMSLGLRTCDNYNKMITFSKSNYFPIQFSPSTNPCAYIYFHKDDLPEIDNKVVELRLTDYNITNLPYYPKWELVRIRTDRQADIDSGKYFGNDYRIAELTWNIFLDPLTKEHLLTGCEETYFMESKSSMYFAQTNVLSFIKESRIEKYRGSNWVIDAASGRGADLGRFIRNEIKNLVCIDQDRAALTELIKRKYDIIKRSKRYVRQDSPLNLTNYNKKVGTSITVVVADFSDKKSVLQKLNKIIPKEGVDVLFCNFAVHYFMGSEKTINNFVSLCKELLCSGGSVVLTFMLGERIFELLKDVTTGQAYSTHDNFNGVVVKNSLKKLYKEDILLPAGQKIGVLLPFSKGEYYEEYLVNSYALIDAFESRSFISSGVQLVSNKIDTDFKSNRPDIYNQLTDDDKTYLNLFGEIIFTKK